MENKNVICYQFDSETEIVIGVKISNTDPKNLETLARIATMHIPLITALRKDNTTNFDEVDLDLPNFPITIKVCNKLLD